MSDAAKRDAVAGKDKKVAMVHSHTPHTANQHCHLPTTHVHRYTD